jgi:hypothetical protein
MMALGAMLWGIPQGDRALSRPTPKACVPPAATFLAKHPKSSSIQWRQWVHADGDVEGGGGGMPAFFPNSEVHQDRNLGAMLWRIPSVTAYCQ